MKKYLLTTALALLPWVAFAQVCYDNLGECASAPPLSNPTNLPALAAMQMQISATLISTTLLMASATAPLVLPTNISQTNVSVSQTLTFVSNTLPTCNTAAIGMRRSGIKSCWCDGSGTWRNMAPAGLVSVLGVNVVIGDTCP